MIKLEKSIIFLLAVLTLATVLRFWQLDSVPPGLYPDVAVNGNNALDALKAGNFKVFYPENNGREGLFFNLIALSFALFGPSVWAIKVVAALIGVLTVWGVYLLAKELFSERTALLSSFLLATSFWHLNFSRLGFRAIMVPFCLTFAFYFLFKGLNRLVADKKFCPLCPILAGLFFGLGFHTYISFRVAPLILPFILIPFYFICRRQGLDKKYWSVVAGFLLSAFLVALPIGLYFMQSPSDFIGRASGVSVFGQFNPLKALLTSLAAHLGMFNFVGDFNWRHNISGSPVLFWPAGLFFLAGLFLMIKQAFSSLKNKNLFSSANIWFLLVFWSVMLLPGILTSEAVPHSLRVIGAIPSVFILAGLGLDFMIEKFRGLNRINQSHFRLYSISFCLALLIISFVGAESWRYFDLWGKNPEVQNAFSADLVSAGRYLNSLPENVRKYVVVNLDGVLVNGLPMPAQTPIFIERTRFGEPRATYLLPQDLQKIQAGQGKAVVVLLKDDTNIFNQLKALFPQGNVSGEDGVWRYEIQHKN